jgi:hypothetical protein
MDNITVVFVAFNNFEACQKNLAPQYLDDEYMEEYQYPEKCVADFEYIQGISETPRYLKPKPKGFMLKYEPPTIITSNPDELYMMPPQIPTSFYSAEYEAQLQH